MSINDTAERIVPILAVFPPRVPELLHLPQEAAWDSVIGPRFLQRLLHSLSNALKHRCGRLHVAYLLAEGEQLIPSRIALRPVLACEEFECQRSVFEFRTAWIASPCMIDLNSRVLYT